MDNIRIPIVSIVVQGGFASANLVIEQMKRRISVVVMQGSGGFADILSYVFNEVYQQFLSVNPSQLLEDSLKEDIIRKIKQKLPKANTNSELTDFFSNKLIQCVRLSKQDNKLFMTIINIHDTSTNLENISEDLLNSLLRSQRTQDQDEEGEITSDILIKDLYLAIDWNCPAFAKSQIFSQDISWMPQQEKTLFNVALNFPKREEFVDLFLSNGFKVHNYLTPTRLRTLFRSIHEEEFFKTNCYDRILGYTDYDQQSKHFVYKELNWLIKRLCGLEDFIKYNVHEFNVKLSSDQCALAELNSITILAMWAVFSNRLNLAKVLWKNCDHPVHLSLTLSTIYKRLSWYVDENYYEDMIKAHNLFRDYAVGVFNSCYLQSSALAIDLLNEENPIFNNKTAVDYAADSRILAFIAHPMCQRWITRKLNGRITIRSLRWGFLTIPLSIKIILCAIFVFPMYIWIRFDEEEPIIKKISLLNSEENLDQRIDESEDIRTVKSVKKQNQINLFTKLKYIFVS